MRFRRPERSAQTADRSQNGFALLLVLWFLVLIAAIGAYMVANARSQTALARNILAAARAEAVADAAVPQAVFNLMDPDPKKRYRLNDTSYVITVPGGQATLRLEDERSKINPNLASDKLLTALFEAVGVDNARSGRLGACIADWVSKGDQARPLGAKLPEYQSAGRKYGPPGAPVESMDELQLVLGMTPELLAAVQPYLTIFTSDPQPLHLETAAAPVIRAVQIVAKNPTGDAGGPAAAAVPAPGVLPPPPGVPPAAGAAAANDAAAVIVSLTVTGRSFDGGTFVRHAVVKLDFDNPKGYSILEWRRGTIAN